MTPRPVVVYYRVSSRQQKRSGLGLLAQQDAVRRYLDVTPGNVVAELTEVESGRKNDRPRIVEALWLCRVYEAKLVIARLDRLARSTAMIARLMESRVDFVAADFPLANRFTIHILAAVAEYEAKLISQRTKAAIAAGKARGRKYGGYRGPKSSQFLAAARVAGLRALRERQRVRALDFAPLLRELRDRGETLHGITVQLSLMGVEAPFGGKIWQFTTVRRMFEYAGEPLPKLRGSRRSPCERRSMLLELPLLSDAAPNEAICNAQT